MSPESFWQLVQLQNQKEAYSAELYAGRRYNSNDDITYRLVSGLASHCYSYLESDELIEMHLIHVLKTLSLEEKQYLVVDAARDCAGADHWYTFEKDWG